MANIITAIDIGSSKVVVAIAIIDENGKPKIIGEASYPSYGVKKGEIVGIDDASNSIASALLGAERMAGISTSSATVSINGRNIMSNNNKGIVAVATPEAEITNLDVFRSLEQAKTYTIPPNSREMIHIIAREFKVDQQTGIKNPVGMKGGRLDVDAHIVSVPSTSIHNLQKCLQQNNGIRTDNIVFTGIASAKAVLTQTERELGVILLDFGGGTVSIEIFNEDAHTYSASIPWGGSNITRDISGRLLGLALEDAEKIKVNYANLLKEAKKKPIDSLEEIEALSPDETIDITSLGIDGIRSITRKDFEETVAARITEIFGFVQKNIEESGFDFHPASGIVITGGGAMMPGVAKMAQDVFKMPARIGHPRGITGLVEGISSPAYATLQGLILMATEEEVTKSDSKFTSQQTSKNNGSLFSRVGSFFRKLTP